MPKKDLHRLTHKQTKQISDRDIEIYRWQVKHIQEGLASAERGEFATDSEVKELFSQLNTEDEANINSLD